MCALIHGLVLWHAGDAAAPTVEPSGRSVRVALDCEAARNPATPAWRTSTVTAPMAFSGRFFGRRWFPTAVASLPPARGPSLSSLPSAPETLLCGLSGHALFSSRL